MHNISKTRKVYFLRLCGRVIVLFITALLLLYDKKAFEIVNGLDFFKSFSLLHILWIIWMIDMTVQLLPVKAHISIGSQKIFSSLFKPVIDKFSRKNLTDYIKATTASAYKVMIIWVVLVIVLSLLYLGGVISSEIMILISVVFYVCDLICVLIWCPFRLIMHNKCCTTCRIFNWDHLMMFLPIISLNSFFSWSLVIFSFIIWLIWEICVFTYPERFWENSNMALKCSECTDKLCTQYCRKLRK